MDEIQFTIDRYRRYWNRERLDCGLYGRPDSPWIEEWFLTLEAHNPRLAEQWADAWRKISGITTAKNDDGSKGGDFDSQTIERLDSPRNRIDLDTDMQWLAMTLLADRLHFIGTAIKDAPHYQRIAEKGDAEECEWHAFGISQIMQRNTVHSQRFLLAMPREWGTLEVCVRETLHVLRDDLIHALYEEVVPVVAEAHHQKAAVRFAQLCTEMAPLGSELRRLSARVKAHRDTFLRDVKVATVEAGQAIVADIQRVKKKSRFAARNKKAYDLYMEGKKLAQISEIIAREFDQPKLSDSGVRDMVKTHCQEEGVPYIPRKEASGFPQELQ